MTNGKIAMKFENGHEDDRLIRVRIFTEDEDVFLATEGGKCVRFPVTDARVFSSRNSTGVRGIRLADGDQVIFMAGLTHIETEVEARDDYLRSVNAKRRLVGGDYTDRSEDLANDTAHAARLDEPLFQDMMENEQFILTVTEDGFGKRSSAYDYRISKRGGKGIDSIDLKRGKNVRTQVVATVPVFDTDQMVMVSDGGQLIRMPVDGISFTGRTARGVTLFRVSDEERVVSVTRLRDVEGDDDGDGEDGDDEEAGEEGVDGDVIEEDVTEGAGPEDTTAEETGPDENGPDDTGAEE
jgi:DNA gyrase subunit A